MGTSVSISLLQRKSERCGRGYASPAAAPRKSPPPPAPPLALEKKPANRGAVWLWSVEDYSKMIEAGILRPEDRVELIEGEILPMVPMGSAHAACVSKLDHILHLVAEGRYHVRIQCPLHLGERSEPEPDVLLLAPREDFYESAHPTAADVLLLIEVGDTSIAFDREVKIPLYARHGVPEVWLIDLAARCVEVYRSPGKSGYRRRRIIEAPGELRAARIPALRLQANSILPGK